MRGRARTSAGEHDCATALQEIARDCLAIIKTHHGRAGAADAEALHQIRVAITRLRAAVTFFAPIAVDREWLRLKREIAWLNISLGAARDGDVVAEYARHKRYRAWAERALGERFNQHRRQDGRRLVRSMRSARFRRLIAAMESWIEHGSWLTRQEGAAPLQAYCARELNRWRRRLIRKGRHLETLGESRRHSLRIKAKRFRYMLEALTETVAVRRRADFRRFHGPAKRLQRALGDLRDLKRFAELGLQATAPGDGQRGKKRPPGYRRRREKLLNAAVKAHRTLKQAGAC
ncbi:CHAD domain-containing protein [Bradyrhizobium sp.]|uniref:CHAD domain-containing protein n=1 Tax=Bradyrhizobium sp. TaxID=376 RepID=UPI0025BF9293|nr:CHAD domain-containing protein [Bradyrhizobium sp.]